MSEKERTSNFKYRARDRYGKPVSGIMRAASESAVAKHLSSMGYIPIAIQEAKGLGLGLPWLLEAFEPVRPEDINLFTRQLLTLQRAGIPLLTGLNILEKQTKNKRFKDIIKEMAAAVEAGSSLSDAMAKHPKLFSDLYVNMIKAGEASGLLDDILGRLAEFGEKDFEMRSKITAATRYPMITLCALFIAFLILVNFVIPKFSAIFSQFKTALPLPTRVLLGLSVFMRNYWYLTVILAVLLVYLFSRYINTRHGRYGWDSLKLNLPIFGPIASMFAMSRFSRTTSVLLRSGLPVLQVLDLVSRTVGNAVISRAIEGVAVSVREGKGIAEPLRISGIFSPMVVNMIAIGEETGKVDELLMKVAEYYDQQSDYSIRNLTTMIEPLFVLILGVMVLTMALAVFLPMWNLVTLFRH